MKLEKCCKDFLLTMINKNAYNIQMKTLYPEDIEKIKRTLAGVTTSSNNNDDAPQ
jgi:hypothetical protein